MSVPGTLCKINNNRVDQSDCLIQTNYALTKVVRVKCNDHWPVSNLPTDVVIIIIIIRLYNTVGEENRVVREVNRDRLC